MVGRCGGRGTSEGVRGKLVVIVASEKRMELRDISFEDILHPFILSPRFQFYQLRQHNNVSTFSKWMAAPRGYRVLRSTLGRWQGVSDKVDFP
jgi:hypothetical protein